MLEELSTLYLVGSVGLGIMVPSVCGFLTMFYKTPHHIVRMAFRYQMYQSGMKKRFVRHGKQVFCYGEKNSPKPGQPSLVFLHGFTASKLQWLPAFKNLRTDCHMIALDLPGHGDSSIPEDTKSLNLDFMDSRVRLFLDLVGLGNKKIHVVGASMGGALAGIFSAINPEKVVKVTMVCPAMKTPVENEFFKGLKGSMHKKESEISFNDCVFFPEDILGMREMFKWCTYHKDSIDLHPQIFQGMLNIRRERYPFYIKLFKAQNTNDNVELLSSVAPSIKMPSQIIWGRQDEIMHYSGAEYLRKLLPDCRHVEILEKCGHAVDIDRPDGLCKALSNFMK